MYLLGTGKTMIVKAVANATSASFIRVVGSEFVQKYLGEVSAVRQYVICSDRIFRRSCSRV
jgi:ATP-dependent 26S proteasome regulatory subunit